VTEQGDHVVLKCSGDACGMRYPSPVDDHRRHACPLCEAPVSQVATYDGPPLPVVPTNPQDGSVLVGVLDNIRSAQNVGTMLRSADGVALDHLYLGGLTASADNPKVIKTALGAELSVPSTSFKDTIECIDLLRGDGFEVWAIDYTSDSIPLQGIAERPAKLAFVMGNERAGVDPAILLGADRHIHLDMYGAKTTLNVGVTFGAVAYWLRTATSVA
jgi:23S rRNA (guanosine2251-2'-O)-methyltransferase